MIMLRRNQQKRTIDPTIHVTCCPCVFALFGGVSFAHRWMIGVATVRSFSDKLPPIGAPSTSDVIVQEALRLDSVIISRSHLCYQTEYVAPEAGLDYFLNIAWILHFTIVSTGDQLNAVGMLQIARRKGTYDTTNDGTMTTYAADIDPSVGIVENFHQKR